MSYMVPSLILFIHFHYILINKIKLRKINYHLRLPREYITQQSTLHIIVIDKQSRGIRYEKTCKASLSFIIRYLALVLAKLISVGGTLLTPLRPLSKFFTVMSILYLLSFLLLLRVIIEQL